VDELEEGWYTNTTAIWTDKKCSEVNLTAGISITIYFNGISLVNKFNFELKDLLVESS